MTHRPKYREKVVAPTKLSDFIPFSERMYNCGYSCLAQNWMPSASSSSCILSARKDRVLGKCNTSITQHVCSVSQTSFWKVRDFEGEFLSMKGNRSLACHGQVPGVLHNAVPVIETVFLASSIAMPVHQED